MPVSLVEQVLNNLQSVQELYHRLILIVGPAGSGKTRALQEISARTSAPCINVNLELSRRMLEMTGQRRIRYLPRLLEEIIKETGSELVLLDNIEILFDVSLKSKPMRLLQGLSRNRTLVVAWNGTVEGDYITCAVPGHPEYRRYRAKDIVWICSSPSEHEPGDML